MIPAPPQTHQPVQATFYYQHYHPGVGTAGVLEERSFTLTFEERVGSTHIRPVKQLIEFTACWSATGVYALLDGVLIPFSRLLKVEYKYL